MPDIVEISNLLFRTTAIFIVLLILTRILGKKQLSQLTFFNYVTGITIGSIAANIVSIESEPFIDEFIGLFWWCVLATLTGVVSLKSGKIRQIIQGQPSIVIKRAIIDKKALKKCGIDLDDISMMLREQNIFSITEVEYAILEPNGQLSVMKKPLKQQVTKGDMDVPITMAKYLPSEIIVDGKIIYHNLREYGFDEQWLNYQLQQHNINSPKEVLYAEIQEDGTLYLQKN